MKMGLKIVIMTLVLHEVIIQSKSDNMNSDINYILPGSEHIRVKRAKYFYSGVPSNRIYRRPPLAFFPKGYYSATPPPGYYVTDEESQYPAYPRLSKVSTRSTNEALGDGDLSNLVKYLTKQDLDKIIEFSGEKERYSDKYRGEPSERHSSDYIRPYKRTENQQSYNNEKLSLKGPFVHDSQKENQYKIEYSNYNVDYDKDRTQTRKQIEDSQKFSLNGPYISNNEDEKSFNIEYNNPNPNTKYIKAATQPRIMYSSFQDNAAILNPPWQTEDLTKNYQISYANSQNIFNQINEMASKDGSIFTDSSVMREETLPVPVNLRHDIDNEVAYTNKVPAVAKAESSSYEVEGFGDLPLMNYHNSKLHTVSSYNVPHYTVTSPQPPPPVESPADFSSMAQVPESVAKAHSDAHLKAVRIWTHKSRGTAYTLYNDGTLALEPPSKPKYRHP